MDSEVLTDEFDQQNTLESNCRIPTEALVMQTRNEYL
jgi:hypothetical protein